MGLQNQSACQCRKICCSVRIDDAGADNWEVALVVHIVCLAEQ